MAAERLANRSKGEVKNQGLWRGYLQLVEGSRSSRQPFEAIPGTQNEACDAAVRFAQSSADELLALKGDSIVVDANGGEFGSNWILLDGRDYLRRLRGDQGIPETVEKLVRTDKIAIKVSPRFVSICAHPKDPRPRRRKLRHRQTPRSPRPRLQP